MFLGEVSVAEDKGFCDDSNGALNFLRLEKQLSSCSGEAM